MCFLANRQKIKKSCTTKIKANNIYTKYGTTNKTECIKYRRRKKVKGVQGVILATPV